MIRHVLWVSILLDICAVVLGTLRFLINVLDQIRVLVGTFVKFNKRTGPNKHTGAKLLPQKCNFS